MPTANADSAAMKTAAVESTAMEAAAMAAVERSGLDGRRPKRQADGQRGD
jgi:hypothetical protein